MKKIFCTQTPIALSEVDQCARRPKATRTETPWHSIHGHGWSMAVPSLARPGPWMDQGWQSPLLSLARPGNQKSGKLKTAYRSSVF